MDRQYDCRCIHLLVSKMSNIHTLSSTRAKEEAKMSAPSKGKILNKSKITNNRVGKDISSEINVPANQENLPDIENASVIEQNQVDGSIKNDVNYLDTAKK
ncbi:hypothetical protein AALO_G00252820 [Alosa alosa]|uniref:Uncharacterized protein n=1 Tax=Alosa alosa TaxID=278164 RepID=A0AAV6FT98_9TELE|nr:hypothetical protein AALO_G00252820 [Alosa alosa]